MIRAAAITFLIAGQYADVLTYAGMDPANEGNPVILFLGPIAAIAFKFGIVALVLLAAHLRPGIDKTAIMLFGGAVGIIGALTNVL